VDIDGEAWLKPPCIGADQYVPGGAVGPLGVTLSTRSTNVAVGFALQLTAQIEGHATGNVWDFGDGTLLSNRLQAIHSWVQPGTYTVRVAGYNESLPDGLSATVTVKVSERLDYYVNQANPTPVFPYGVLPECPGGF
jgi:PKD repeat protein